MPPSTAKNMPEKSASSEGELAHGPEVSESRTDERLSPQKRLSGSPIAADWTAPSSRRLPGNVFD